MANFEIDTFASRVVPRLMARLEKKNMAPATVTAVKQFLNGSAKEIEAEFLLQFRAYEADLEKREARLADAEAVIKKAEEMQEKFPDPRARQAMTIYREIVDRYEFDEYVSFTNTHYKKITDEQAYRNAILSAGKIVAAYLGESKQD